MYARMNTLSILPGKMAEFTRAYNDIIMPAVKHAHGNTAVYFLVDEANNTGVSITLWVTEADGEDYDTSGVYHGLVQQILHLLAEPPTLTKYEVASWG